MHRRTPRWSRFLTACFTARILTRPWRSVQPWRRQDGAVWRRPLTSWINILRSAACRSHRGSIGTASTETTRTRHGRMRKACRWCVRLRRTWAFWWKALHWGKRNTDFPKRSRVSARILCGKLYRGNFRGTYGRENENKDRNLHQRYTLAARPEKCRFHGIWHRRIIL